MSNIRENWILLKFQQEALYNGLGIPIAAGVFYPLVGVLLSPILAGIFMACSSLGVVINANRLYLFRPSKGGAR